MSYQLLSTNLSRILLLSIPLGIATLFPLAKANADNTLTSDRQALILQALTKATFANSPPTSDAVNYIADPRVPQIPSFAYTLLR